MAGRQNQELDSGNKCYFLYFLEEINPQQESYLNCATVINQKLNTHTNTLFLFLTCALILCKTHDVHGVHGLSEILRVTLTWNRN